MFRYITLVGQGNRSFIHNIFSARQWQRLCMAFAAATLAASVLVAFFPNPIAFADYAFPLEISEPSLASVSSGGVREVTAGDDLVITAVVLNNYNGPVRATFAVQVIDRHGFTESIQFVTGTVAPHGELQVGVEWVPEISGDYGIDIFAVDDLDSPLILSEKSSVILDIT
jgi:hypothetical protein